MVVVNSKPRASIILPVKNGEGTIGLSVESLLAQTVEDIEILILDNGSKDRTVEILKSYKDERIRIVDTAGMTLAETLNIGVDESHADICVRMDGDDISYPQRVGVLCNAHEEREEDLIIGSNCKFMTSSNVINGRSGMPLSANHIRWRCLTSTPFMHPTISFKRKRFVDNGYRYPKGYECCEDYALWSEIVFNQECSNIGSCLLAYRLCQENQGNPKKRTLQLNGHDRVIRKCFVETLGIEMSLDEAHSVRSLLVTGEYSEVDKNDETILSRVENILLAAYGRFVALGWDGKEIADDHRLLKERISSLRRAGITSC